MTTIAIGYARCSTDKQENFKAALTSSLVSCGHASKICSEVSPSAMLPTITLTGTRVS